MIVRVTAHLLQGLLWVPGEHLSIDGPLLYAAMVERLGDEFGRGASQSVIAEATSVPDEMVPLDVWRAGGDQWIYCASDGWPGDEHGVTVTHAHGRVDDGMLVPLIQAGQVERRRKVNISAAPYRSTRRPLWTRLVDDVTWHLSTSDPDTLSRLLRRHVHHLGKGRNSGHGVITHWEIETPDAPSDRWLRRPDGSLARPVPLEMLPGWDGPTGTAPFRPPHWIPEHQTLCALPVP